MGKCLSIRARNLCPMLVLVFLLKRRVVPEDVTALSVFFPTVVCSGVHFRRVLSCMEGRLGQRMFCQVIGTTYVC